MYLVGYWTKGYILLVDLGREQFFQKFYLLI